MRHEYVFEGRSILQRWPIDAAHINLTLRAESVHMERTGVHAKVTILAEGSVLAWSTFNIERDEDRVRLANSAYRHLDRKGFKEIYPSTYLKADLDNFCIGLWDVELGRHRSEDIPGSIERRPPDFLVRPWVIAGAGAIVYAPPGRGKSYTLMTMQVSLDAGLQTLLSVVRPVKTLLLNLERSARSVQDRLGNINGALGLPRDRTLLIQNARGKSLNDVIHTTERDIVDHGVECVFVDSISRAGQGDLNANDAVNRIIDSLNGLCPTWVALAHTPRSDESHLYGSIHFEAGADVVVQLLSEQEQNGPLGVGLQLYKENDIGKQPMWVVAYEFDGSGLTAIRRARSGEFPSVESKRKMTMKEEIREHLLDVGPCDAWELADVLGHARTNIVSLLKNDPRTFVAVDKIGRKQRYAVLA